MATGLSVAASMALAIGVGAVTEDPAAGDPPAASRAPDRREEFLLLTDGRMIHGVISREGSLYVVKQKLGTMRFPKKIVEGSFGSIREAFRHKEQRLPEEDPAERMKLARWCLNLQLTAEAKEQLVKVLEISPDHGPAQAMLANMEYTEKRQANRFDPEVRQTAAEEDVAEDRAGALDSAVLRGAERRMGLTGLPVIFNLPRPLAIRRAEEFAHHIQPLLQIKCAKCHNAGYEGMFQLVPIVTPRQQTPDALRANLDATLRLVDPENPARSDLLSSTLRPHGVGARKRPIFTGSNDRAYRILEAWVNGLRPPDYLNANGRPGARSGSDPVETFGSDRSRPAGSSLDTAVSGMTSGQGGARGCRRRPRARTPIPPTDTSRVRAWCPRTCSRPTRRNSPCPTCWAGPNQRLRARPYPDRGIGLARRPQGIKRMRVRPGHQPVAKRRPGPRIPYPRPRRIRPGPFPRRPNRAP